MISVESITVREFRGIRDLTLELGGKSFAICGPNGSGKSGVVDALEFALTGRVSRLSGEGRGDVSLRAHAPHVDVRNDAAKSCVVLKARIPSLNMTVTIERSPSAPASVNVTPKHPAALEVLQQIEMHPEIVLSRRELIRYVLATPGRRAEQVQALLHLDEVEKVRVGLQKIANDCERQLVPLRGLVAHARDNLLRALQITELRSEKTLVAANTQRVILGLPPLTELTDRSSLKEGMTALVPPQPQRIPKAQALADLRAARDAVAELASARTRARLAEILADLTALVADPAISKAVTREGFYTAGFELIETQACPLCDTAWEIGELKKHVQAKIDHLKEVTRRRSDAQAKIAPLIQALRNVCASVDTLTHYAALAKPPVPVQALNDFGLVCVSAAEKLARFVPLVDTIAVLPAIPVIPSPVFDAIRELERSVLALPEPTKQDAAKEWLIVAEERLEVWRAAKRKRKAGEERARITRHVSDVYDATSDMVLTAIYEAVEKDFVSLYRFVNRDDESTFAAKLIPSTGKLGFDVDFYGRGLFPPDAYHSEGHQDGMGLCLYLALMRYLHGDRFTIAVLDDVLMSVDAAHRREVCTLLKKEFPRTQLIMTTHDPIWLRHLKTEGIIGGRSAVQFRSWSIDQGPTQWDDRDIWTEIGDHLKRNDVRAAAALLRHYLEYTSAELCHRLRAPVEFRGDAQYQLGELLPAAISHMRWLHARAKEAANSWNQKDIIERLVDRASTFAKLADASNAEQWQVNVAVHFNSWDNLGKKDFEPVVNAFRDLLVGFTCPDCGEYVRVSPERETAEVIRCDCGQTNVNLRKKSQ